MTPRLEALVGGIAAGVALSGLAAAPLMAGLSYLAAGLVFTFASGWRNRSTLRRAVWHVAEEAEGAAGSHPRGRPGMGWKYARLTLFAAVLFCVLCWPVMVARDVYDWWVSTPEGEDEA